MRKPTFAIAVASLLVSVGACAAPREAREAADALAPRATFAVKYTGALTSQPAELVAERNEKGPVLDARPTRPTAQVDVRLVEVERDSAAAELGLATVGVAATAVDSAALNRALTRLRDEKRAEELAAPRLMTRDGEEAVVSAATQLAYVGAFALQGNESAVIADPDVRTVAEGTAVKVRPQVAADRGSVELDLELRVNFLVRPIPVAHARPFSGPPIEVQLPVFLSQRLETKVRLENGTTAVIRGLSTDVPDKLLLALVSVKVEGAASDASRRVVSAR